ncbi:MAG: hypothetical protein QXY15_04500 [Candidatus Nitrosotenuis sp.]
MKTQGFRTLKNCSPPLDDWIKTYITNTVMETKAHKQKGENDMSTVNRLKKEKAAVEAVLREIHRRDLVAVQKKVNELVEITSTENYMAPAMYRKWAYYLNSGYININVLPLIEQDLREQLVMINAGIDILESRKKSMSAS